MPARRRWRGGRTPTSSSPRSTARPIEPRNFNRAFEAQCRKAGVPRIRVHDTRHTCASLLAALDVHPRVAMRILRQISMTMDVYTQIPSPETRKALDRLNASLDIEEREM
ncbi:tyrosine-type recombinase/integrase [Microbispora rosea]